MNFRQYARHRGCADASVYAAVEKGKIPFMVVGNKRIIDADEADKVWSPRRPKTIKGVPTEDVYPDGRQPRASASPRPKPILKPPKPKKKKAAKAPEPPRPETSKRDDTPEEMNARMAAIYSMDVARAKRESHEANISELKEREKARQVIERTSTVRGIQEAAAGFASSFSQLAGKLSMRLAAEKDPVRCREMIQREVNIILSDLSTHFLEKASLDDELLN